jgi:hypothetical protein
MSGISLAWGQQRNDNNLQVAVAVYNDADVPGTVLHRAESAAAAIFARAGVRVEWADARVNEPIGTAHDLISGNGTGDRLSCSYAMRIIRHSRNLSGDIFGLAFLGPDGSGRQADVFYANIAEMSAAWSRNPADVLGHVMAHELGHLLLGASAHSPAGIMRLHWGETELQQAARGSLLFDEQQSHRIRERLLMGTPLPEPTIIARASH